MLIPRFSIRWLLGLTTFSAFVSLVLSYAVKGEPWAMGIVSGLWALVASFLFFAGAFLAAWFMVGDKPRRAPVADFSSSGESPVAAPPLAPVSASQSSDLPPPITG